VRGILCLNTSRVLAIDDNVFWHQVYMARPPHKNPGFKIDKVNWKKLLVKKDTEEALKLNCLKR